MTEAWVKREMEQQQLLENLEKEIFDFADGEETENRLLIQVAISLIRRLQAKCQNENRINNERVNVETQVEKALAKIRKFKRTDAEGDLLKKRLMEKVLARGLHWVGAEYMRQSVHEPEKLYEGHGAMDEVDL